MRDLRNQKGKIMILGTANFNNTYRGKNLDQETCFDILKTFEELGGVYVETAFDYGNSLEVIWNYKRLTKSPLKIINKIRNKESSIRYPYEYMLVRGSKMKIQGENIGQSIYYPYEINPNAKMISIPASEIFIPYLPVMNLHAKVIVRSIYNLFDVDMEKLRYFKKIGLIYDFVIGVDNKEQLIENMRLYHAH